MRGFLSFPRGFRKVSPFTDFLDVLHGRGRVGHLEEFDPLDLYIRLRNFNFRDGVYPLEGF